MKNSFVGFALFFVQIIIFIDLVNWFLSLFFFPSFGFWKDQNTTETMLLYDLLYDICQLMLHVCFCSMIYNIFIYLKTNIYILLISETFNVIWRCPEITNQLWKGWGNVMKCTIDVNRRVVWVSQMSGLGKVWETFRIS